MFNARKIALAVAGVFAVMGSAAVSAAPASTSSTTLNREAGEAPRGADKERPGDRQRGRVTEQFDQIAREASEPPRGADKERAGDRQRGRNLIEEPVQIAREASEGPRGGDHERPGDRQNRGGRGRG
jgi:hypothetical protein